MAFATYIRAVPYGFTEIAESLRRSFRNDHTFNLRGTPLKLVKTGHFVFQNNLRGRSKIFFFFYKNIPADGNVLKHIQSDENRCRNT